MRNLLVALLLIGIIFFPGIGNANTYYVSTGGNDSNPGTISQPFRTLQRISSLSLAPGDIVYIRAGTYNSGVSSGAQAWNLNSLRGASGNPILISAYPGDFPNGGRVVFDCGDFVHQNNFYGVVVQNSSYITVRGIRVTNVPQQIGSGSGTITGAWWVMSSSNIIIDNCEGDHSMTGFRLDDGSNVTFNNCDAHHIDDPFTGPPTGPHNNSDGFSRTGSGNMSTNTIYKGCRSWWCSDDGWDCFGTNGTITYDHCWAFWNGYGPGTFNASGDGNGIKMGGSPTNVTSSTTRFVNNCVAFQNRVNGFDQNAGTFIAQLYNNTSFGNGSSGYKFGYYTPSLHHVFKNNISYGNANDYSSSDAGGWIQSNNSWNGLTVSNADFISLTNSGVDGPRQPDGSLPVLNFLHLTSTSKLVGAGTNVGLAFTGSAPDLGAFESGTAVAPNRAPLANAGPDQSFFFPANSTTLTGSGTDADGTISSYQWTKIQGPAQYNIASPTLAKTSISNLEVGVYLFELTVTDNSGATAKDTVQITVNASSNQVPVANAGNSISIVLPTNSASLDGSSSSDADGTIVSYQWTKVFGPSSFVITDPSSKTTGVNSMVQGVYQFELKVTDDKGAVGKDTVKITVNAAAAPANQAPIADAGPDMNITLPNNSITLSGSANDPDGTIASSQWTKVSGPSQFTIESATQEQTVVDNLLQGTYKFELRVTDNAGANAKDTVLVTVNGSGTPAQNQAPTANAGPDINITLPNNSVTLSGSGTDADGSIASYQWTKFSGPSQYNITSATQNQTGVNNLTQGIYKFELKVTDNSGASARDTVWVTVNAAAPANQAPKATAGPDITITLPTNSATLSGGGSDPDGTITSYQWKKVSGPSQYNIASSTVAITSVGNLAQGTYKFELTVTDNGGASARDTMLLIVNTAAAAPNKVPVANAGLDLNITLPTNSVILSGSGSDPDGTIAAYKWTKISGPSQSNIVSSTKAQTTVNNLSQGIYQFELTVTDNSGATAMDAVQVTVNPAPSQSNHPPTANAGSNQVITLPANSVTLSGSGTDADGKIASYQWRKVSGPSEYNISSSTKAKTSVDNLVEGSYEFELTVTDNSGATAKATVQVTVNPAPLVQNKAPEASAGSDLQTMLPMDTITLSGNGSDDDGTIASYKWEKISGPSQYSIVSPSKSRTLVRNLKEGIYEFELTVTDNAGAFAKDTVELAVISAPKSFARVFPNPATNVVNIQIEPTTKTTKAALRIYDNKGLLVFQEDFVRQQQGMIKQVSIIKLPSGIYFAELQTDINNIVTLRFMKK